MKIALDKGWLFIIGGIIIFIIIGTSQVLTVQQQISDEWIYDEKISSYVIVDGLTYRSQTELEYVISNYNSIQTNELLNSLYNQTFVNYTRLDLKTGSEVQISQELKYSNIDFKLNDLENGTLGTVDIDISLFRLPKKIGYPWVTPDERELVDQHLFDRWNVISNATFFRSNLGYYEVISLGGKLQKVRTNLEIVTNTDPSTGRVLRTSVHIVRRTLDQIIVSEYNRQIYEKTFYGRVLLSLDKPGLETPLLIFGLLSAAILMGKSINAYRADKFRFAAIIFGRQFGTLELNEVEEESPSVEEEESQ